jgi:hypothetical protein
VFSIRYDRGRYHPRAHLLWIVDVVDGSLRQLTFGE